MDAIIALFIFIIVYIAIVTEKFNRTFLAVGGGLTMVIFGIVDVDDMLVKYIDWETIALLFSMMIIVSITSHTGLFEFIAVWLAQKVNGGPLLLLVSISGLTAIGSAFLDNVTMVMLLVPIVLNLTEILDVSQVPYLTSIILFSNIGGTATLIGDPPNIMIGQVVDHLEFNDFLIHLTPVVLMVSCVVLILLTLIYKRSLFVSETNRNQLLALRAKDYLQKGTLLIKSISVLGLTLIGFLLHPLLHVELTTVAMLGALLIILLTYKQKGLEKAMHSVEWMTLFFFVGLFMLVGGLKESGLIDEMAKAIIYQTKGDIPTTSFFILWVSGLFSGFVDNIPFVATMIPIIQEFKDYGIQNVDPLWWSLSLGACLGGNGTLIGASANVIVAGAASKKGSPLGFVQFMKIGFPVVLISLFISSFYLYFRYLIYFQ